MKMAVRFSETNQSFGVKFCDLGKGFSLPFRQVQTVTEHIGGEPYDGEYTVTPKVEAQTMPTKGKVMVDDVTVKSIPFFNVGNTAGGSTVYIAKEV